MGFSFRKSIDLGLVRINFSKSGVGFSFGVPGARIVKPARGKNYISIGKFGLFFRKIIQK